jgi:hypothetical protein
LPFTPFSPSLLSFRSSIISSLLAILLVLSCSYGFHIKLN